MFYRHELQAERETEKRKRDKEKLETALQEFHRKLNKRKYRELGYCQKKLAELLDTVSSVKEFVQCDLSQADNGSVCLTWLWNETALEAETNYDGIFALLTNYTQEQVNKDQLISKYRSRDEIEVDFKQMKGLLNLERILFRRPEKIECHIFLKVVDLFVLTFYELMLNKKVLRLLKKKYRRIWGICFWRKAVFYL